MEKGDNHLFLLVTNTWWWFWWWWVKCLYLMGVASTHLGNECISKITNYSFNSPMKKNLSSQTWTCMSAHTCPRRQTRRARWKVLIWHRNGQILTFADHLLSSSSLSTRVRGIGLLMVNHRVCVCECVCATMMCDGEKKKNREKCWTAIHKQCPLCRCLANATFHRTLIFQVLSVFILTNKRVIATVTEITLFVWCVLQIQKGHNI